MSEPFPLHLTNFNDVTCGVNLLEKKILTPLGSQGLSCLLAR